MNEVLSTKKKKSRHQGNKFPLFFIPIERKARDLRLRMVKYLSELTLATEKSLKDCRYRMANNFKLVESTLVREISFKDLRLKMASSQELAL